MFHQFESILTSKRNAKQFVLYERAISCKLGSSQARLFHYPLGFSLERLIVRLLFHETAKRFLMTLILSLELVIVNSKHPISLYRCFQRIKVEIPSGKGRTAIKVLGKTSWNIKLCPNFEFEVMENESSQHVLLLTELDKNLDCAMCRKRWSNEPLNYVGCEIIQPFLGHRTSHKFTVLRHSSRSTLKINRYCMNTIDWCLVQLWKYKILLKHFRIQCIPDGWHPSLSRESQRIISPKIESEIQLWNTPRLNKA